MTPRVSPCIAGSLSPDHSYQAVSDDYEPGDPIGYGRTEEAAVADLKDRMEERE